MKKSILAVLVFLLGVVLTACNRKTYEFALVTDVGTISDQSFNQAAWTGLKKFGEEFDKTFHYYQPTCTGANCEVQDTDRIRAVKTAVKAGAKVIVMPGFLFGDMIDDMAVKYPNVKFIGIDVTSHDPHDNVRGIFFKDYEAGFLAGYAVVMEGKTKLGFMGGMPVPAVKEYGTGYIAGALQAANEKGLADFKFANERYMYLDSFMPADTHKTTATAWYNAGVEVIFACAGGAGLSVHDAAKDTKKVMVGVDVDQSYLSEAIITSAVKKMGDAVYESLVSIKDENFQAGTFTKGVAEGGSDIVYSNRFKNFTQAQYTAVINKIKDKTIKVPQTYEELVTFATNLGFKAEDYPTKATVYPGE